MFFKLQSKVIYRDWELPTEDVLYASIDHNNLKPERQPRELADSDCDYAVVRIPKSLTDTAKQKSSEDCSDDYVLMG
ncbi:hypothetical protein E1301_Tti012870 [Triplophysa tibetana]|uniref:Uncharacterized protein n=1 Tax=Triplophysa tibetana TaxID=1572043 RepID=A0A5A9P5J8_9TELE|nr:hypothetical protein E1301_Tti012870 [Triplophysa tibetana]